MMKFKNIFLGLCIAAASLNTFAQQSDEHKDHHPEKTAPSAVTIKQTVTSTTATDKMAAMDQHMKAMQAMHEKMMAAKTPQERQKLMGFLQPSSSHAWLASPSCVDPLQPFYL